MIIKRYKTETFVEHAYCDCGGEYQIKPEDLMTLSGSLAIWPPPAPKYIYICQNCGHELISEIEYPRVIHHEIEE